VGHVIPSSASLILSLLLLPELLPDLVFMVYLAVILNLNALALRERQARVCY
jgi:hypothetical protein